MDERLQRASDRLAEQSAVAREWLRRVMPRVAVAAVVLFVLRLFVRDTSLYRETPLRFLGLLTLLAACATLLYYGVKVLVRLKRLLLWRVRRRLIITYLFVGVTPIVLLLMLGALAAVGGSSQTMVRVVSVEISSTERQALEGARALAEETLQLPATNDRSAQTWLDEHASLLRASLPGARVSVWRSQDGSQLSRLGEDSQPQLASVRDDDSTRGVGRSDTDEGTPLPAWLEGRAEWSGLAYLPPPEDSGDAFGTPCLRALVRRESQGHAVAVLVTVPVSRALVGRYRENTGVGIHPYFIGAGPTEQEGRHVEYSTSDADEVRKNAGRRETVVDFRHDQFGEAVPEFSAMSFPYPVILRATDWRTGRESPRMSFIVDWSWAEGGKQFWNDAVLGQTWWSVLYFVAVAFLVLEILALFSAGWMTRAVTGTVHKLYRATEAVKRGDFSHRIRTRSRDQLGELALAFNDMSSDIETLLAESVEHERLKREVEIAHEVQAQLFPRSVPLLKTAQVTGECRAALGVAGDYYDYIDVAPGLVAFALGDVSGKGISASLVMSNLQAALRAQVGIVAERMRVAAQDELVLAGGKHSAAAASADVGQAFEVSRGLTDAGTPRAVASMAASINTQLCQATDANRFATLFVGLYDDRTRMLRFTNAGHNAPILVRAGGSVERLWTGGTVLGAFPSAEFDEGQTTLGEGDLLVIFSDGITEAHNHAGEEYGEARLTQFVVARRREMADNIRQEIFDDVDRWSGGAERGDDQTVVILKAVMSDK